MLSLPTPSPCHVVSPPFPAALSLVTVRAFGLLIARLLPRIVVYCPLAADFSRGYFPFIVYCRSVSFRVIHRQTKRPGFLQLGQVLSRMRTKECQLAEQQDCCLPVVSVGHFEAELAITNVFADQWPFYTGYF